MRRGFTLIELLVICAILATMVSIGVGSIVSGQDTARVKGATRDVYAAIRNARSTALVTGQRVLVTYSNETVDGDVMLKVDMVAAKIMSASSGRVKPQPYYVLDYKDLQDRRELVHFRGSQAKPMTSDGDGSGSADDESGGDALEDILFAPMNTKVVKGMRIKVLKGDEALKDETAEQAKSRISVFSNVDYLMNRYQASQAAEAKKKEGQELVHIEDSSAKPFADGESAGANDGQEPVSVVWETNGAVEPHRIWVYPDGKKPEDGLMLNIDQFGAVKVTDGDGREDE